MVNSVAIDPPMPKSVLIQRVGLTRQGENLLVVVSGKSCTWLENVTWCTMEQKHTL